jgi:hypothetical protein
MPSRSGRSPLSVGFTIRSQIIWNKDRLIIGRGNYHWNTNRAGTRSGKVELKHSGSIGQRDLS